MSVIAWRPPEEMGLVKLYESETRMKQGIEYCRFRGLASVQPKSDNEKESRRTFEQKGCISRLNYTRCSIREVVRFTTLSKHPTRKV